MKIGIITHYDVHNHGAQLQMFALITALRQKGYDVEALTYKKNYDFLDIGIENKYNISVKSIPIYIKYLFEKGIFRTIYNIKKRKILQRFRDKHQLIGDYYSKSNNLDLVIIGSDEVFSLEPGLNPFFWGIGVPCKRVVSYAASFGPTTIDFIESHYASEFVSAGLNRIEYVSVRDQNSYNICSNFTKKPIEIVCDPVLLYDFQNYFNEKNRLLQKKDYCIVYSYDERMNDCGTVKAIRSFAKKENLIIVSVGYYHGWCDKNVQADPLALFSIFKNAKYVFTDTFHGSVISIVTGTQFFTKISGNSNKLAFLMEEYGLQNRILTDFSDLNLKDFKTIDFSAVSKILAVKREKSFNYLENILNNIKNG